MLRIRPTLASGGGVDDSGAPGPSTSSHSNVFAGGATATAGASVGGVPAIGKDGHGDCIHAVGSCSIAISAPEGSAAYKTGERGGTYTFSRVAGPATTQAGCHFPTR